MAHRSFHVQVVRLSVCLWCFHNFHWTHCMRWFRLYVSVQFVCWNKCQTMPRITKILYQIWIRLQLANKLPRSKTKVHKWCISFSIPHFVCSHFPEHRLPHPMTHNLSHRHFHYLPILPPLSFPFLKTKEIFILCESWVFSIIIFTYIGNFNGFVFFLLDFWFKCHHTDQSLLDFLEKLPPTYFGSIFL